MTTTTATAKTLAFSLARFFTATITDAEIAEQMDGSWIARAWVQPSKPLFGSFRMTGRGATRGEAFDNIVAGAPHWAERMECPAPYITPAKPCPNDVDRRTVRSILTRAGRSKGTSTRWSVGRLLIDFDGSGKPIFEALRDAYGDIVRWNGSDGTCIVIAPK